MSNKQLSFILVYTFQVLFWGMPTAAAEITSEQKVNILLKSLEYWFKYEEIRGTLDKKPYSFAKELRKLRTGIGELLSKEDPNWLSDIPLPAPPSGIER